MIRTIRNANSSANNSGNVLVNVSCYCANSAVVKVPQVDMHTTDNPTPYGYTVSLLLFLVPVITIAIWHWRNGSNFNRRAFYWCAGLMTTLGALLDIFFGYSFFRFPNEGATMGIRVPAWSWADMAWIPDFLPLEEFTRKVEAFIAYVKSCPRIPGVDEIFFPGEIEYNEKTKRLKDGVFIEPDTWKLILETAQKVGAAIN